MPRPEPNDWCLVSEQKYSSLRPSYLSVPNMVFINKTVFWHAITSRHWLFPRDCFTGTPIKLLPVTIPKTVIIYGRASWVKTQFPLWVRLQVPKYVKRLIKTTDAWYGKLSWQKWCLQKDGTVSNLQFPTNLTSDILEMLHTIYLKFWWLFQPWRILAR